MAILTAPNLPGYIEDADDDLSEAQEVLSSDIEIDPEWIGRALQSLKQLRERHDTLLSELLLREVK